MGEHIITNQLRFSEEQDAKVRHLLTLSGGVLVVAVATSGLVTGRSLGSFLGWFDLGVYGFLIPMTLSFFSSFWAFLLFATAYNGSRRHPYRLEAGWNPQMLVHAATEADPLSEIYISTIYGVPKWYLNNRNMIEQFSRIRSRGTMLLLVAGASLSLALIYAVGASIS